MTTENLSADTLYGDSGRRGRGGEEGGEERRREGRRGGGRGGEEGGAEAEVMPDPLPCHFRTKYLPQILIHAPMCNLWE